MIATTIHLMKEDEWEKKIHLTETNFNNNTNNKKLDDNLRIYVKVQYMLKLILTIKQITKN